MLLCEDHEIFRLGLRVVFEAQPDMAVVAEARTLAGTLTAAGGPGARVVVVRQGLVGPTNLLLLRDVCEGGTSVLMLAESMGQPDSELIGVLQAGVRGLLPRQSAAQQLVDAVRALARRETAFDPLVARQLVHYVTGVPARKDAERCAADQLTERQRDVALLVAEGLSNREIASRLFLSPATVKSHITAALRRFDIRTRTQLAILLNGERLPAA
ncbi:response regulator transcription factor [Modestobacter italicus]|uniref:response regulator transcription factor n=1 Tax=Modestobacter italicus (strain DSM 44449 / CECT 9708 / BC 501) TaxID=2732864 RepID=UPI001E4E1BC8|nr:response regulator transcription factor [Modestobacter marinus]